MIKKDYQKPTMKVVKLLHHGIICTSGPRTLTGPNNSGSGSDDDDWYELE